ncbi:DUF7660 family protein [Spongiimicrobium salis]|uniref:DUF7660 family protein n=1 Tax=Spongiimicrobium salis TaxID=1667022 RepID=UPI00374C9A23
MTRLEFVKFLEEFRKDLMENKSDWQNNTLEDFLEAMQAYATKVQGFYDTMKMDINADEPTWENFKTRLKGARIYE